MCDYKCDGKGKSNNVKLDDLLDVPYVNQGRDIETGLDCWGLAMVVCKRYGVDLPEYVISAKEYAKIDRERFRVPWEKIADPHQYNPPLLVVIRMHPVYYNHIGVWIGGGRIIHTTEETGVVIESLNPILKRKIEGYYNICSR